MTTKEREVIISILNKILDRMEDFIPLEDYYALKWKLDSIKKPIRSRRKR